MRLEDLSARYPLQIELQLLVPTLGRTCRPRPILLLHGRRQSVLNFLMSRGSPFLFNIADVVKLRSPTKMDQVVHRTQWTELTSLRLAKSL
jgi:hypothetical protein